MAEDAIGCGKPKGSGLYRGPFEVAGLFLVGAVNNRPRKRKRTNRENPRTISGQIGEIKKTKSGKSQKKGHKKECQVQIGKPPHLKRARLPGP